MLEIEKFLKDIDLDNLGKKFSQKRNSFTDKINSKQHKFINQKLFFCAVSLDLCLLIYQEYMTAFVKNINELNKIEEVRIESYGDSLSKGAQFQKETKQTFEFYESSIDLLYLELSHAKDMFEVNTLAYKIRINLLSLSLMGIVESFELLISQNDPTLLKERIISVLKILFGFEPSGLVSLGWDIYDYARIEESRTNTASEILNHLDNFARSTFTWCIHAKMLIDFDYIGTNLQGTPDDKTHIYKLMLNNARTVVNNKLKGMLDNINKKAINI